MLYLVNVKKKSGIILAFMIIKFKVSRYTFIFFLHVYKEKQLSRLTVCLPGGRSLPKKGLLLKKRICSNGNKLFPL